MLALRVNSRVGSSWITYPRNAPVSGPALPTDFRSTPTKQTSPLRRPLGADTVAKVENGTTLKMPRKPIFLDVSAAAKLASSATQQTALLSNHFIGACKQRGGNRGPRADP